LYFITKDTLIGVQRVKLTKGRWPVIVSKFRTMSCFF